MRDLQAKRKEILEAISPICEAFKIDDFDYIISETGKKDETQIIPKYLLSDYYVTDEISYNFSHYTQGNARYLLLGATQIKTLSTYAVDVYGLKLILKSEVVE